MNKLSVIIPSRDADNLAACVRAVRQFEPTLRIIVVDDRINWDRYIELNPDMVEDVTPNVVEGVKPFVFARNVNRGIQAAGTDDVILLNDDALLRTASGFSEMQKAAYEPFVGVEALSRSYFGIVGAVTNNVGNENQFPRANTKHRYEFGRLVRTDTDTRPEPRMLCFICVFIPRSTVDLVGLLDERYIGYGMDDDDYSLSVRRAGLSLGVFDGCFVDHASLKSSYRGKAGAGGDFHPNLKLFIEKWGVDNRGHGYSTSPFKALFPEALRRGNIAP